MLIEKAYAKINLGLKVLGKRSDGYHEIDMIMQSIALFDTLEFYPAVAVHLRIKNSPELLADTQENLIIKAAKVLKEYTGCQAGATIILDKKIPLEAGLAGGSADAAAALRGLNNLWELGLNLPTLEKLAAKVGSDVAFCVRGGIQRATGRGELVEALPDAPAFNLIVFKPFFGVSTAQVYQQFSLDRLQNRLDINKLIEYLCQDDIKNSIPFMGNELESVTLSMHPILKEIKNRMLELGASYALMSGSGPSIFAIVADQPTGDKILDIISKEYQGVGCVTKSMSNSKQ